MSTKYLLPCHCGREIPVEVGQAGQSVRCACGHDLEIPTMLRLTALPRAEAEPQAAEPRQGWGARQALILIGLLVCLAALAGEAYLYQIRPRLVTAEMVRQRIQTFTPRGAAQYWRFLRAQGPTPNYALEKERFEKARFKHHLWMGVLLAVALGGVALVVVGALRGNRPPEDNDLDDEEEDDEDDPGAWDEDDPPDNDR